MPIRRLARWPKCYWIICYLPPPDWRSKFDIHQIDAAKLSPEVRQTLVQALGKMPNLGAIASAPRVAK